MYANNSNFPTIRFNLLPNNTWRHYAAVVDGTIIHWYENGFPYSQQSRTPFGSSTTASVFIGDATTSQNTLAISYIDDFRVYNDKALTATEINQIYSYRGYIV